MNVRKPAPTGFIKISRNIRRTITMKKMNLKRAASLTLAAAVAVTGMGLTGCDTGSSDDQVIIYSNADEEAITAMENALDNNGYEGRYTSDVRNV